MVWIIELIQLLILTVNSQCILCQIVGTDTEEIYHFCKSVTDDRCCRSFNHNSLLRNLVLNLLCFQLLFNLCHDLIDFLYFLSGSDHGIHNRQISIYCCSQKSTKLCLEDFRLLQADTDCTITHSRIIFISQIKVIYLLVCSDIQCTDDHLLACHHLYRLLIGLELFLLCREIISAQIQEFTSEKADSSCIIFHNIADISNTSDISINVDLMAIQSHVFLTLKFLEQSEFLCFFRHFLCCLCFHSLIRLKDHSALESIYNCFHSCVKLFQIHIHTDQRWNIHHTCKNCCMGIGGTVNCHKCQDLVFIHLYRFTRAQIICHDD